MVSRLFMFRSLLAELIKAIESDAKFISSDKFDSPVIGLNCKSLLESRFNDTRLATRLFGTAFIFKSGSLVSAEQALQTSWFTYIGTNSIRLLGKSYLLIIALTFSLGFSSK